MISHTQLLEIGVCDYLALNAPEQAQAAGPIYQGDESDLAGRLVMQAIERVQFLREQALEVPRIKSELL